MKVILISRGGGVEFHLDFRVLDVFVTGAVSDGAALMSPDGSDLRAKLASIDGPEWCDWLHNGFVLHKGKAFSWAEALLNALDALLDLRQVDCLQVGVADVWDQLVTAFSPYQKGDSSLVLSIAHQLGRTD